MARVRLDSRGSSEVLATGAGALSWTVVVFTGAGLEVFLCVRFGFVFIVLFFNWLNISKKGRDFEPTFPGVKH